MIIEASDPATDEVQALFAELGKSLVITCGHFAAHTYGPADAFMPRARFVIARSDDGSPLGCGALRPISNDAGELKRMFARPGTKGVGAAVLKHLEEEARGFGYKELVLETGTGNAHAIAFYERNGYVKIPCYGDYAGKSNSACYGKQL